MFRCDLSDDCLNPYLACMLEVSLGFKGWSCLCLCVVYVVSYGWTYRFYTSVLPPLPTVPTQPSPPTPRLHVLSSPSSCVCQVIRICMRCEVSWYPTYLGGVLAVVWWWWMSRWRSVVGLPASRVPCQDNSVQSPRRAHPTVTTALNEITTTTGLGPSYHRHTFSPLCVCVCVCVLHVWSADNASHSTHSLTFSHNPAIVRVSLICSIISSIHVSALWHLAKLLYVLRGNLDIFIFSCASFYINIKMYFYFIAWHNWFIQPCPNLYKSFSKVKLVKLLYRFNMT